MVDLRKRESECQAIHSHDVSNIFNMMHVFDEFGLKVGKYFFDPQGKKLSAFFVRICQHKAVDMN